MLSKHRNHHIINAFGGNQQLINSSWIDLKVLGHVLLRHKSGSYATRATAGVREENSGLMAAHDRTTPLLPSLFLSQFVVYLHESNHGLT